MSENYFKYRFSDGIEFNVKEKEFVTIIGGNNDLIVHTLLHGHKKCNIFVGDLELNKLFNIEDIKEVYFMGYQDSRSIELRELITEFVSNLKKGMPYSEAVKIFDNLTKEN